MTPGSQRSKRARPPLRGRLAASIGRLHQRDRPNPLQRPEPPLTVTKPTIAPSPESQPMLIAPSHLTQPSRKPPRVCPPLRGRLAAVAGQLHDAGDVPEPIQRTAPSKRSRLLSATTSETPIKEPLGTAPPPKRPTTTNPMDKGKQIGRSKPITPQRIVFQVAITILIMGTLIWLVVSLLHRD